MMARWVVMAGLVCHGWVKVESVEVSSFIPWPPIASFHPWSTIFEVRWLAVRGRYMVC